MDATRQQMFSNTGTSVTSSAEHDAQPPAQVTEGGFQAKVNNALSGSGNVDRVQAHTERQDASGAERQMDVAQEALNSK